MTCITCPTFAIAINRSTHGLITGKRGLRQRDPLSPALFLLCIEYFSRLLTICTNNPDFRFHPKRKGQRITHLTFADDLLLFSRGDIESVKILVEVLNEFSATSRLIVNREKSSIYLCGVCGYDQFEIIRLSGFRVSNLPIKYLGLPLTFRPLLKHQFGPLFDQISSYINSWNKSCLCILGRAELIRAVIQGVECFWIQSLPLPACVSDQLNTLSRRFLKWNSFCPISWRNVCLPKDEGGLGIRELATWNKALLSKIIWNIQNKADLL